MVSLLPLCMLFRPIFLSNIPSQTAQRMPSGDFFLWQITYRREYWQKRGTQWCTHVPMVHPSNVNDTFYHLCCIETTHLFQTSISSMFLKDFITSRFTDPHYALLPSTCIFVDQPLSYFPTSFLPTTDWFSFFSSLAQQLWTHFMMHGGKREERRSNESKREKKVKRKWELQRGIDSAIAGERLICLLASWGTTDWTSWIQETHDTSKQLSEADFHPLLSQKSLLRTKWLGWRGRDRKELHKRVGGKESRDFIKTRKKKSQKKHRGHGGRDRRKTYILWHEKKEMKQE